MTIHQLFPREAPSTALSWQDRLDAAKDEHDLIVTAKDYVASFDPWEIDRLPEACRPTKFFEADDISSYALTLLRHHCGDDAEAEPIARRLTSFFSQASIRLSQIMAEAARAKDDSRQSA